MERKIRFTKMHGLGNDYIYINTDAYPIADLPTFTVKYSDRHFGIGGDGIVTYSREEEGLYRMRIFNIDGSEGLMCGNAIRCVAKLLYEGGLCPSDRIDIVTASGVKHLLLTIEDEKVTGVRVDMNPPAIVRSDLMVSLPEAAYTGTEVSMGNPHFVAFIEDDIPTYPLDHMGPQVEQHQLFPERINFEIAKVIAPSVIQMRVYERGSGLTLACGTGACAAAVAGIYTGRVQSPVTVQMPGGDLLIEWSGREEEPVYMTGPAEIAFEGEVMYSMP